MRVREYCCGLGAYGPVAPPSYSMIQSLQIRMERLGLPTSSGVMYGQAEADAVHTYAAQIGIDADSGNLDAVLAQVFPVMDSDAQIMESGALRRGGARVVADPTAITGRGGAGVALLALGLGLVLLARRRRTRAA